MGNHLSALLQECDRLKARLSDMRPLPAEALRKIEDALDIEYTYESNRIEGNTLTLRETARGGIAAAPSACAACKGCK